MKLFSHSRHRLLAWYNASAVKTKTESFLKMQRSKNTCVPFSLVLILVNSAAALTVYGENEKKTQPALKSIYLCSFSLTPLGS